MHQVRINKAKELMFLEEELMSLGYCYKYHSSDFRLSLEGDVVYPITLNIDDSHKTIGFQIWFSGKEKTLTSFAVQCIAGGNLMDSMRLMKGIEEL